MTLPLPGYLKAANIQDDSVRYEWDDWRDIPAARTPDEELVRRFDKISDRAVLAFMCATSEWIVHRFSKLFDYPAPLSYLEAAWATTVSLWYGELVTEFGWESYVSKTEKEWRGPVKTPIADALQLLEEAIQLSTHEGTDPGSRAGRLAALATYVMTDPAPYKTWTEQVMGRLERLYPLDPEDQQGDVVPREALDPAFDFHIEQTEALVNKFLASLDPRKNMFLSPAKRMIEEGFPGTPYVFDLEQDRKLRREMDEEEPDEEEEPEEDE
jgi:hypothetical protein